MTAPARFAAVYARISTEKQNPLSPEDQVRKCREYAQAHRLQVLDAHIYRDDGLSGAGADRPGLARLLDAALSPARPFHTILVDDTSRLSRSTQDALSIFARLNFAGVQLVAVSQGIDSAEDQAEVLVTVHGMVDSLYVRELAKKTHRGLESKILRGLHAGGRCFGYSSEKTDAGVRLVVNQAEAAIVRRIFELSATGASLKTITGRLNAEGVPAPRPRKGKTMAGWCPTAIREMLRNERYVGRVVWNRHRFIKVPGTNRRVARPRPKNEWLIEQAPEQRIVSEDLWNAVQARLRWVAEHFGAGPWPGPAVRGGGSRYLFSGLLYCSECGSRLTILYGRGETGRARYGCPRNYLRGTCGNDLRERQDRIEAPLLDSIQRTVLQPAAVEHVLREAERELDRRLRGASAELAGRRARKMELEKRLRNLAETAARTGPSDFLVEQITADEAELRQIAAEVLGGGAGSLRANLDGLRKFVLSKLADVRNLLLADVPRARAELARHVDRIVMRPEGKGAARHYVASGQWDFIGSRSETGQAPGLRDRGACMVAGA